MLDSQSINASGEIQERMIILKQDKYVGMKPRVLGKPVSWPFGEVKEQNIKDSSLSEQSPEPLLKESEGRHAGPGSVNLRRNALFILLVCMQFCSLCPPLQTERCPMDVRKFIVMTKNGAFHLYGVPFFLWQWNIFKIEHEAF